MQKLTRLSEKIFLDRYALKDDSSRVTTGDTVVAVLDGRREVGEVKAVNKQAKTADIETRNGELVTLPFSHIDLPSETKPEHMWLRVANGIAKIETKDVEKWQEQFYWLLENWRFVPGGRILSSVGAPGDLTAYNCYVLPSPHDSRGGIMETLTQMTEIMARGGGVGINISSLRPNRALVRGVNGRSSGSVSWGGLYSYVTGLTEQAGSRRGALMLILNDWHPDLIEFINSKRIAGQITNANISVGISDEFMEAVERDKYWQFWFPNTEHPKYDSMWNGNLDKWVSEVDPIDEHQAVIPWGRMKARDIWNAITESAWASAEPGIWFGGRSNKMSNSWYYTELISTNPCVTGDTRVFSGQGLVRIEDLVSQDTDIAIDGRFGVPHSYTSRVFQTGFREVCELLTKEGYKVRATADHKIMTPIGWVELGQLDPGDKVRIMNREGCFGTQGSLGEGRVLGWFVGDGHFNSSSNKSKLDFYHEKRVLAEPFAVYVNNIVAPLTVRQDRSYPVGVVTVQDRKLQSVGSVRLTEYILNSGLDYGPEEKNVVPESVFRGTREMQLGFLQALFSADGTVLDGGEKGGSVRLSSSYPTLLEGVQLLLANFGIASRMYWNRRKEGYRMMPDGNDGLKPYWCRASHELAISKYNLVVFAKEIGFLLDYKQQVLLDYIANCKRGPYEERFLATVKSVKSLGVQPVYDLTEPLTHSFIANGIVVHNCGEQPLPANSVCNLGAVNLAHPDLIRNGMIHWDTLYETVRLGVRFLDNVIDQTTYFSPEIEKQQKGERRIGLGVMGLGEMLIRLKVRYGSAESENLIDKLFVFITKTAYESSISLAKERDPFPFYEPVFIDGEFVKRMTQQFPALEKPLRQYGIRNVTLLTVAPTGSTASMVDTSTGIEPFYAWEYTRSGRLGTETQRVKVYEEWLETSPRGEVLPDYFVTAMDLLPEEHVRVQAAAQMWVDSAISKTCNVPHHYTVAQVRELYELMYRLGCKGGTVYRDGSRDEQVLSTVKEESNQTPSPTNGKVPTYRERPIALNGQTWRIESPLGTVHVTVNEDEDGPFEVFVVASKSGTEVATITEALGRLISLILRIDQPGHPAARLKYVMNQLSNLGGSNGVGFGPNRVSSLPDAVAQAIGHYSGYLGEGGLDKADTGLRLPEKEVKLYIPQGDICPECGQATFIRQDGCQMCILCGYSRC